MKIQTRRRFAAASLAAVAMSFTGATAAQAATNYTRSCGTTYTVNSTVRVSDGYYVAATRKWTNGSCAGQAGAQLRSGTTGITAVRWVDSGEARVSLSNTSYYAAGGYHWGCRECSAWSTTVEGV